MANKLPFKIYLDIVKNTFKEVSNKGLGEMFKKMRASREAWWEKEDKILVGRDQFGNEYYTTSKETESMRNRWVDLKTVKDYVQESSSIPSEWHLWLHYLRDSPPTEKEMLSTQGKQRRVIGQHYPNETGERDKMYYPTGHFLNPSHKNQGKSSRQSTVDLNQYVAKTIEARRKKEMMED